MTGWEQPRNSRVRRSAVAACAVIVMVVIAQTARSSDPGEQLQVTRDDSVPVTGEPRAPAVWPQPVPATWRRLPPSPLTPRVGASVVWTGHEVIVWGGYDSFNRPQLDGAAFNPALGIWRPMTTSPARDASARGVLSGTQAVFVATSRTWQYDPRQRGWRARPSLPLPNGHRVADRVIAIDDTVVAITEPRGGEPSAVFALEADADAWTRLPDVPVPLRRGHVVLGARGRLLVIGRPRDGQDATVALDPADTPAAWRAIDTPPALPDDLVALAAAAAPDGAILLWGTRASDGSGERAYASVHDRRGWRDIDAGPLRPTRTETVVWTGDRMLVWSRVGNVGASFDLESGRWTPLPRPPGPDLVQNPISTGSELFVWGVLGSGGALYTTR